MKCWELLDKRGWKGPGAWELYARFPTEEIFNKALRGIKANNDPSQLTPGNNEAFTDKLKLL
jgi:hypothetical protein